MYAHWRPAPQPEPAPIPGFGAGEAAALALAARRGWPILVNEQRAAEFARNDPTIPLVVTLPGLVVILTSAGIIDKGLAYALLRDCESQRTAVAIVTLARQVIDALP
jgi:hypothetical protein